MMELRRLLEIDQSLVAPEARKSLLHADRVWKEEACPREACTLVGIMEKMLRCCVDSNIWYAPVSLQRKKASIAELGVRAQSPASPAAPRSPFLSRVRASPKVRKRAEKIWRHGGRNQPWRVFRDTLFLRS